MTNKYRKCVGMMILNNKKEILVGKRLDHPSGHWQMPQGGIDENEICLELRGKKFKGFIIKPPFLDNYSLHN